MMWRRAFRRQMIRRNVFSYAQRNLPHAFIERRLGRAIRKALRHIMQPRADLHLSLIHI